jgi:hypothetical protein
MNLSRIGALEPGDSFRTLLTRRLGRITKKEHQGRGVRVDFGLDNGDIRSQQVHPDCVVEVLWTDARLSA